MKLYIATPIYDNIWLTKVLNEINQMERLNLLISYYYHRDINLEDLLKNNFTYPYPNIFVDSGAYTAKTKGIDINILEYGNWVRNNIHFIGSYSNLDVIGNSIETMKNQRVMEDLGLAPLPVFHVGTSLKVLIDLLDKYEYISIGGMAIISNSAVLRLYLNQLSQYIFRYNFHGFGCGRWQFLITYPWASIDSTGWAQGIRFGNVPIFTENEFVKLQLGDYSQWKEYKNVIADYGFDFENFAIRENNNLSIVAKISILSYLKAQKYLSDLLYVPQAQNIMLF